MVQVNALGDACPIPVIKTLHALQDLNGAGTVQTLVDNEIAVQNLTRLAESKGCSITTEKRSDKEFCVTITTENSIGKAEADEQIACTVPAAQKKTVVVISADHMGEGDEELGRILMKGFIFALTQQEHLPSTVKLYYEHPNANVDIAVLPLNGKFITDNNIEFASFDIDKHAMTSEELRYEGVDEGTLIHMLGFPMGLVNINSNLPICRLGCIARISAAQILESYNILADIQNFPGNSGSPIVTRPEIVSIEGTKSLNKSVLVGIVHSYIPYRENLINSQTQQVVEIRSENSGIALIHPVEFIREVVDEIVKPINEKANSQNQTEEE